MCLIILRKSLRVPLIIYADLECLFIWLFIIYTLLICSFTHTTKNKLDYYRGKNCTKNFCLDSREHATKIINYEKKEMIPSIKEEKKHNKQDVCNICKKRLSTDDNNKKYHKVRNHCHYTGKHRGAAHDICNLRYKIPKEIPVAFHNDSTYDYHFIIKELAEEFEGEVKCLGENTEKYITFSVPIKKETTKKDKNGNDKITKISNKIKFIHSCRFMSTSLSNTVSKLSEGLHNDRCKDFKSCLDYMTTKDEELIFRCFRCKKNYEKNFNKKLIQRFVNTYEFRNGDLNKCILLFGKGVYPYEYMDSWQRFDETSLPDKEVFYSNLNMEDITDVDHRHGKTVFEYLINKNLGDYYDLYVQNDTLLLVDVFENFRNTCIKVCEIDPAHFLSAPGLAWQASLKKKQRLN